MCTQTISSQTSLHPYIPRAAMIASTVAVVTGLVTGLLITLAAYQIFPSGVNGISQLGALGQGVGYGLIAVSLLILSTYLLTSKFFFNTQNQSPSDTVSQESDHSKKTAIILETEKPAPPVKKHFQDFKTLEELFADLPGFLDRVPNYPVKISDGNEFNSAYLSDRSLLKGSFSGKLPFIALKVRCVSSSSEIVQLMKGNELEMIYVSGDELTVHMKEKFAGVFVILFAKTTHGWRTIDLCCPITTSFIRGSDTLGLKFKGLTNGFFADEMLLQTEEQGFALFKQLLLGVETADLSGIRWQLA